jgi:hypothetical protein
LSNQAAIQEKYGSIARSVTETSASACCDPITKDLYGDGEKGVLPEKAILAYYWLPVSPMSISNLREHMTSKMHACF